MHHKTKTLIPQWCNIKCYSYNKDNHLSTKDIYKDEFNQYHEVEKACDINESIDGIEDDEQDLFEEDNSNLFDFDINDNEEYEDEDEEYASEYNSKYDSVYDSEED